MTIYVGNISDKTAEVELRVAFEQFGKVIKVTMMTDRVSETAKRFGLIEMGDIFDARQAIDGWNGQKLDGKVLLVNEAPAEIVDLD